ncbi:prephenate dehydrogenase [Herbinix luporum]|jgi:prephenate dehydrogenase|uniref:prephenate dehydrogenase n=1 Tax=Herbinix luporum TaxID=1679721 RepID=UPI0023F40862|nr:prephenate dehydrogenase [Herbinix luporum]
MKDTDADFIINKIGFIGFGLIGGSIARAIKKSRPHTLLYAYDHHANPPSADFKEALSDGVLDYVTGNLTEGFPDCDIIFLCAPVLANVSYLENLKHIVKPSCIITDVGSVKDNIHQAVTKLEMEDVFIGGHPMTGSEKTGYVNSYALLLENAYYILTPTSNTSADKLKILLNLIEEMGSIPIILDPKEHDEITAAISHLPHIIAATLVNLIRESGDISEMMKQLAAGGFKDITRIASSSPQMWQNICLTNSKVIKNILNRYIKKLETAYHALDEMDGEYLYKMFDTAGEFRDSIPNKSIGLINRIFEIYVDIIDETGAIASIAALLAGNHISIKNIGIIHNREFEEGVLRIEFYDEESEEAAKELLKRHHYHIHER